jgi:hypothetical protein
LEDARQEKEAVNEILEETELNKRFREHGNKHCW